MDKIDDKTITKILNDPYNYTKSLSVSKIVSILKHLSQTYYNTNKSLVPDSVFDTMKDILKNKYKNNKFLEEVGAPISKKKVKLPSFMSSLDKIKPDTNSIDAWKDKYSGPYTLSDKLDGVSALLCKKSESNIKLYTRGNGIFGQDITHLIPYVIASDLTLIPSNTEIRGELIITKNKFQSIKDKMANARNAVAGLVNAKNYSKEIANITTFVAYSIMKPRYKYSDQMKYLKEYKLHTVHNKTVTNISNDILSALLINRREHGTYEVDGIVVLDNNKIYDLGNKNPKYGFAFKQVMTNQVAEATVIDVLWQVSKDGYLKPRIKIEPITLVGVTITYATAFNAKFIVDNKLGPGSTIKLVRSGDVIPHIMKVLTPASNGQAKMPLAPYEWNKTKVDLVLQDMEGDHKNTVKIKKLRYFFKTLNIKYLDEGILTLLVNNGMDSIEKIIDSEVEDFSSISGLGDKIYWKIMDEIEKGLGDTTLETLMSASQCFGRGLGSRKIKLVLKEHPNILSKNWTKDVIKEKVLLIKGFDEITAEQFSKHFQKFQNFFKSLSNIVEIDYLKEVIVKETSDKMKDQTVVFTGFRDKDLEKKVEMSGGKVTNTVTSNTTILVHNDDNDLSSSKFTKAKKHNIKLFTRTAFSNMFAQQKYA